MPSVALSMRYAISRRIFGLLIATGTYRKSHALATVRATASVAHAICINGATKLTQGQIDFAMVTRL